MAHHGNTIQDMSAVWLLPIVSTIVAAATGGIVAGVIPDPQSALITILISYVLWATGVPLAMVVLVIYFLRLTTQRLPPKALVVSTFLPLGPLGQGGFAIMQLGKVAKDVFPDTNTVPAVIRPGDTLYVLGFLIAIVMWGFGLVWLCFALATIVHSKHFPFNMGWWGFTFPLGVYTVSTTTLASDLPSAFFRVLGTAFSVAVASLWVVVAAGTLQRVCTGEMFIAPCLREVEGTETNQERSDRGVCPRETGHYVESEGHQ